MKHRRLFLRLFGVLVALGVIAVVVGPMLLDWYATSRGRAELRARGIECDEHFSVDVATLLGSATISPTRCTVAEGTVETVELLDPVAIDLEQLRASRVRAGRARVALRTDPPAAASSGWGVLLQALAIPPRATLLLAGAARLAASGVPRSEVTSVEIVRTGRTLLTVQGLTADGAAPLRLHAARVGLPPLTQRLFDARAAIMPLSTGHASHTFHLALSADGLDGPAPTVVLRSPRSAL